MSKQFGLIGELFLAKYVGNYYAINKIRRRWNEMGMKYYDKWKKSKVKGHTDLININYHTYISFLIVTKMIDLIESPDNNDESLKYQVVINRDDWKNFVGIDCVIGFDIVVKSFLDTILYCPLKFWTSILHSQTTICEAYIGDGPTSDYDCIVIEWIIN